MFFATFGLRAAFHIPTDLAANWSFRLSRARRGERRVRHARRHPRPGGRARGRRNDRHGSSCSAGGGNQVLAVGTFTTLAGTLLAVRVIQLAQDFPLPAPTFRAPRPSSRGGSSPCSPSTSSHSAERLQLLALRSPAGTALYVGGMLATIAFLRDPEPPRGAAAHDRLRRTR
jgi:hypothetical protein